jgi:RNA polymerase sigma-70 factor (ECF subfamily)
MVASLRTFLPGGLSRAALAVLAGQARLRPRLDAMDALIQRAKDGDARALEEVLRRYAPDVARIAHRMLGPSGDLDDVVQEALFQVARSLHGFQGHSKFSTWLYRVVSNVARMHLRAKASRPVLDFAEPNQLARSAASDATPEAEAERSDDVRALYRCLDGLSEKKRTVLVLHDLEGVPAAEIARIVEVPLLTVRTRLFYARKELYAALARDPELAHLDAAMRNSTEAAVD